MRIATSTVLAFFGITVAACRPSAPAGDDQPPGDDTAPDAGAADGPAAPPDAAPPAAAPTIFTIVLENQDYADVVGSPDAPYLNSLIAQYGLATNYHETGSPSLPNYLHMVSGDNQYIGILDVDPTQWPFFPASAENLGSQLEAAGIAWRSYQDGMGTPCRLSASGAYAPKHDPFLYFDDMQHGSGDLCARRNVDYAAHFADDLAAGSYRYMWITPDLEHDGHDPQLDPAQGLRQADAWVAQELPRILASAGFAAGGVVFLTWDEAEARAGHSATQIPMIVISPRLVAPGYRSDAPYTHASYLATDRKSVV